MKKINKIEQQKNFKLEKWGEGGGRMQFNASNLEHQ